MSHIAPILAVTAVGTAIVIAKVHARIFFPSLSPNLLIPNPNSLSSTSVSSTKRVKSTQLCRRPSPQPELLIRCPLRRQINEECQKNQRVRRDHRERKARRGRSAGRKARQQAGKHDDQASSGSDKDAMEEAEVSRLPPTHSSARARVHVHTPRAHFHARADAPQRTHAFLRTQNR